MGPKKKSAKTGEKDDETLRKEAESDAIKPKIIHLEKSAEPDVKKYYKVAEKSGKAGNESEKCSKSRDSSPAAKLRKEAERDIVKPEICHLEESAEPEVKKYFKVVEKSDKAASESENSDKSRDS